MSLSLLQGIWSGMLGGTIMQTIVLLWATFRTNWEKEVISICNLQLNHLTDLTFQSILIMSK